MKLRKGDGPKAALLIVAIIAVFAFIARTALTATGRGGARLAPRVSTTGVSPKQPRTQAAPQMMYAQRPHSPSGGVSRARTAPNPFRPTISLEPRNTGARTAGRPQAPPPVPELPSLRLVGIVASGQPLAILAEGERRFYVRREGSLPGGWIVSRINAHSVVLKKGSQTATLLLTNQSEKR
jgi:hypothetical protein